MAAQSQRTVFRLAFSRLSLVTALNWFCVQCSLEDLELKFVEIHNYFLIWQDFSLEEGIANLFDQWRPQTLACLLNTRQSEAVTVSLFFSPAIPSTTPTHGHSVLSPVLLASRWQPIKLNDHLLRTRRKIGDREQCFRQTMLLQESRVAIREGPRTNGKRSNLALYFCRAACRLNPGIVF